MKIQFSRQIRQSQSYKNRIPGVFALLLTLVLMFSIVFPSPVMAQPQPPFQLYGNVTINDAPAPAGVSVTASIGGVVLFSSVTDASGRYGYSPVFFRIPADDPDSILDEGGVNGDIVQMAVAGIVSGNIAFSSGAITNLNLALTAPINKLAFITPVRAINAGSVSNNITIQLQDSSGAPVTAVTDILVNLTSTSVNGKFALLPSGPFNGSITSVIIPTGTSTATFYYSDTVPGTPLITASSTGITSAAQTVIVNPFTLTVIIIGNGTVTQNPDLPVYNYGDNVILTAIADSGWFFAGWSGGATGTDNPKEITILADTVIYATFTQYEYTLNITIVGGGAVTKNPDNAVYHLGDVVTLTAIANPGWTFAGWSGDTGTIADVNDPTTTITMNGNYSIIANFVPEVPEEIIVPFNAGWNTFSTPISLDDSMDTWGEFINTNPGLGTEMVYAFNPGTANWVPVYNDTRINPLEGFYIKTTFTGLVQIIPNSDATPPPIRDLPAGVSLIGIAPDTLADTCLIDALFTLYMAQNGKWGYEMVVSPYVNPEQWSYNRDNPAPPLMKIGRAYWLVMANADIYVGASTTGQ